MPNRTMCEVLEEMRTCCKTLNFSYLLSLIEEVQVMGNKMEATISDKNDVDFYLKKRSRLRKEVKELESKIKKIKKKAKIKDDEDEHDLFRL